MIAVNTIKKVDFKYFFTIKVTKKILAPNNAATKNLPTTIKFNFIKPKIERTKGKKGGQGNKLSGSLSLYGSHKINGFPPES